MLNTGEVIIIYVGINMLLIQIFPADLENDLYIVLTPWQHPYQILTKHYEKLEANNKPS